MVPLNNRKPTMRVACLLAVGGLLAAAGAARAGDPVPDVDVILEQVPGGVAAVEVRRPTGYEGDPIPDVDVILEGILGFDSVRLSGDKALATLSIVELPAGWGMRLDGKRVILSGPTVVPPVRFQFEATERRPERVSVELLRGKQVVVSRMKIQPRIVPQRTVAGTLTGTLAGSVRLPPQVSAGETLALRALPGASLPPGGVWVISGTVAEPWDGDDLRQASAIVNTTRSQIRTRSASAPPASRAPIELRGDGGCASLAPVAALLHAGAADLTTAEARTAGAAALGETAPGEAAPGAAGSHQVLLSDLSPAGRTSHQTAMGTIRNLKFFFAVAGEFPPGIAINEEEDLIAIKEKGIQRIAGQGEAAAQARPPGTGGRRGGEIGKTESWTASSAAHSYRVSWTWADPPALTGQAGDLPALVAFDGETTAGGCRFVPREAGDLDLARWARMQVQPRPTGRPSGKPPADQIQLVTLPIDLRPGDRISARYLDEWGDPWVEVADVPDVEVVAPQPGGDGRFIESASAYVVAGDQLCVCGTFSALDAVAAFTLASRPAEVVAISDHIAWLQAAADLLGPALIQAEGFRGEAATEVIRVRAELDQENLFSGQSTPLRIVVEGSEAPIPIRLHNGTPQAIELEGGPDQETETSGGAVNQVIRQLRGIERGTFELTWELRPAACPCTSAR
jgi:hypothetical protein